MSKLGIPWIANIPVEDSMKIDKELDIETFNIIERNNKIEKKFKNKNSRLRRVFEYLSNHRGEEISYLQMSYDLEIPESTVRNAICDLNFYNKVAETMIPVIGKRGYIQSVLKNEEHYERWDRTKRKTITSMTIVRNKAEILTHAKNTIRKKVKIKNERYKNQMS